MTGWIGISLGDVTGIGPEVTLKALAARAGQGRERYLVIGDAGYLRRTNEHLGLGLSIKPYLGPDSGDGQFFQVDPRIEPLPEDLAPGSPAAARAALDWLRLAGAMCLRHELDGMITSPVNKESILRTGERFVGQTEYLSDLAGTSRTAMMLLGADDRGRWLRVALATTHLPLRLVADQLTREKIELAIELSAQACRDLGLPRARIGVCGLNPHAGEGGELGTEEITTVRPAVEAAHRKSIHAVGPLAADTLFYQAYKGEFDAVVAMYHDQGLGPLKMIGFEQGVNWTLGLPFIRTSPDHGTAYDIAGQGLASPSSMLAAMELARKLAERAGK